MQTINNVIKQEALRWQGVKEIGDNESFDNEEFQKLLEACGWNKSQAWCAYFCEMVWREAYKKLDKSYDYELNILFSAGAIATYNNFRRDKDFVVDQTPEVGAIMIMQQYVKNKPDWRGHAGIVIEVREGSVRTIEGNTNSQGGREGQYVAQKTRELNFTPGKNTLTLKAFIHPQQVIPASFGVDSLGGVIDDDLAIYKYK